MAYRPELPSDLPSNYPPDLVRDSMRILRILRGWSQGQLADYTKLTPSRIFKLEHGRCRPRVGEIELILNALRNKPDPKAADAPDLDIEETFR